MSNSDMWERGSAGVVNAVATSRSSAVHSVNLKFAMCSSPSAADATSCGRGAWSWPALEKDNQDRNLQRAWPNGSPGKCWGSAFDTRRLGSVHEEVSRVLLRVSGNQ